MSWWGDLTQRVLGADEVQVTLTAASPFTSQPLDPDMEGFRRLGGRGDPNRDLQPLEHEQMLLMADYLATRNPMGRRMVGIYRDTTLSDDVEYSLGDEATNEVKDWVKEFWDDNDMENRTGRWSEGVSRHGERIIPASADDAGRVRLGFVHPMDVDTVFYGAMDDLPRIVKLKDSPEKEGEKLPVVRKYQEMDKERPPSLPPGHYEGEVFYWYVNRSEGQGRGLSDLLAFGDWLDALDELLFVGMDRAKTSLHVFFDVTLEGMDETDILTWLATAQVPKPGTLRAHNELVTWELKSPDLASAEIHQLHRDIKEHIVGNAGFPLHWFGTGEGANRAVASEMTMPTLKMLRSRRKYLVNCLKVMLQFVVDVGVRKGTLTDADRDSVSISISIPEMEDSKLGSTAAAVQQVIAGVAIAVDAGWIPDSIAQRVLQVLLSEIGVDFDAEEIQEELEKQKADLREKEEKDAETAANRARQMLLEQQDGGGGSESEPAGGRSGAAPVPPATSPVA